MPRKDDRHITGQDWLIERGTEEDMSDNFGKRVDPFSLSGFIDLVEIYKREIGEESSDNEQLIKIVHEAIEMLPFRERSLIRSIFFMGKPEKQMQEESGLNRNTLYTLRCRAITGLRNNLKKLLFKEDEKHLFPDCPLCNYRKRDNLNVFLHLWFDYNRGTTKGLAAAVKDRFDLDMQANPKGWPSMITGHIKNHMAISYEGLEMDEQRDQKAAPQITMVIEEDMKAELEQLSAELGRPQTHIFRECATLGLPMFRAMVEIKRIMTSRAKDLGLDLLRDHIGSSQT